MAQGVGLATDVVIMQYAIRFIGIALFVGLAVLSFRNFQDRLETIEETGATRDTEEVVEAAPLDDPDLTIGAGRDGDAPEYLAFGETIESGVYDISNVPGSGDEDIRLSTRDKEHLESTRERTDLTPPGSLAAIGRLSPGLYATDFDVTGCGYELRQILDDLEESIIGEDRLANGRMLVSINEVEPDTFIANPACGDWIPWSPLAEPLTVAGNGDYWMGDLQFGQWEVPEGCIWEKVVGFRGGKLWDVQESGHGPEPLQVTRETLGVRIRGCDSSFRHWSVS